MKLSRRTLCAGSAFALLGSGCSSPPARYYRLAPVPGTAASGGPPVVNIRDISIPDYLNQDGIAKLGGNFQFGVYSNDLWAEPLPGMLQSVMVQDLAQRLAPSTIIASGHAIGVPADMLVEINILRFDPDETGAIALTAQVAVHAGQDPSNWRTASISAKAASGADPAATVAAMSQLWGGAADQTARLITEIWAIHNAANGA